MQQQLYYQDIQLEQLRNSLDLLIKDNREKEEELQQLKSKVNQVSARQKTSRSEQTTTKTLGSSDVTNIIASYDWPVATMINIAKCESGLRADAVNYNPKTKDHSIGVFQINIYGALAKNRPSKEWLLNPDNNISYAHKLWRSEGTAPWSCARSW